MKPGGFYKIGRYMTGYLESGRFGEYRLWEWMLLPT